MNSKLIFERLITGLKRKYNNFKPVTSNIKLELISVNCEP